MLCDTIAGKYSCINLEYNSNNNSYFSFRYMYVYVLFNIDCGTILYRKVGWLWNELSFVYNVVNT